MLGVPITGDIGEYLGVPMIHERKSKEAFAFMIDHVKKRLSGWKAKSLSMAGRVTIAQSSLFSIPGYVMQSTVIPASTCDAIEKLCRDFIWGSTANRRRCHLVAWDKVCRPKEEGGLGFHGLRLLNQSYMMKLGWRLVQHGDQLWSRVLRSKYGCGVHSLPVVAVRPRASHTWRGLAKAWHHVQQSTHWVLNNGHKIRFWQDCWVPGLGKLEEYACAMIPPYEISYTVASFVTARTWNWSQFSHLLPADVIARIAALKPPSNPLEDAPC